MSLFGKNGNFFTATEIWASMTKIYGIIFICCHIGNYPP